MLIKNVAWSWIIKNMSAYSVLCSFTTNTTSSSSSSSSTTTTTTVYYTMAHFTVTFLSQAFSPKSCSWSGSGHSKTKFVYIRLIQDIAYFYHQCWTSLFLMKKHLTVVNNSQLLNLTVSKGVNDA
jgi:hypothetical protein